MMGSLNVLKKPNNCTIKVYVLPRTQTDASLIDVSESFMSTVRMGSNGSVLRLSHHTPHPLRTHNTSKVITKIKCRE